MLSQWVYRYRELRISRFGHGCVFFSCELCMFRSNRSKRFDMLRNTKKSPYLGISHRKRGSYPVELLYKSAESVNIVHLCLDLETKT